MSAQLCSVRTINELASFASMQGIDLGLNNGGFLNARLNPQGVADLLLAANMASLKARYPRDYNEAREIQYTPADPADLDPVVILKTANYFNYQSCESAGYYESDAAAMMRCIIQNAIRAMPAYGAAPWGLDGVEPAPVWLGETQKRIEAAAPAQRSILDMCFPSGAVDLEETPLQPITRATLSSMGPTKVSGNAQWAAKTGDPIPAPKQQPKKQPKPNGNEQPDGPFLSRHTCGLPGEACTVCPLTTQRK